MLNLLIDPEQKKMHYLDLVNNEAIAQNYYVNAKC